MLIDTNIIIAALQAEKKTVIALSNWKQESRPLYISSLTIAETLALPSLTESDLLRIRAFLHNFISISFDDTVAEVAALLRRQYHLEIPDAGIAATALLRNVPLVTRDRRFKTIREITVLSI
ncbi:PIN domain-containing protein [Candidatus Wolfebacteria bacterium]|nr:PIN domain-containing protein [Candidatus Wolfebacteria bacterium]